jgi:hypothetical protein
MPKLQQLQTGQCPLPVCTHLRVSLCVELVSGLVHPATTDAGVTGRTSTWSGAQTTAPAQQPVLAPDHD